MTLPDLIERLERAEGPSRELDAEIFIAACHPTWRIQTECKLFPEQVQQGRIQEPDGCGWRNAPAYTASIDAALTLVPEGKLWSVETWDTNGVYPAHVRASVWVQGAPRCYAATPALALCIAALKAQEADRG